MKLSEIEAAQEAVRAELKKAEDDPTADEDYVDTLIARYDELEQVRVPLAERMSKLNQIHAAVKDDETATESGDDKPRESFTQTYRNRRNPFDDMEAVRTGTMREAEVKSRAMDAIEWASRAQWTDFDDDKAELATRSAQSNKGIAAHILKTGSQEYYDDFRAYMRDPEAHRATTVGTGSLGYMLPFVLDPTIILSNAGSMNPYRRFCRVEQTTSVTWNGVTSAGVTAAFGSEAGAATDASPTVSQLQITPQRARAWVFGSYESLEDSDLGAQLPRLFADAKDRLEESAFATGAGTGVFPQGIVTGATTGNTAAATAYASADVYTLQGRLPARFRASRSAAWVANLYYINKTRQFDTSGGSSFWANLGMGTPEQLLGYPIYESTSMSSATASATAALVFMDGENFVIVDRVGMSIRYNDMVMSGTTGNLPTGEAGWYAFWRVSSKVAVATAVQSLLIQ